jgi:protein phosphatase
VDKVPYWEIHLIHTQSGQDTVVYLRTPIELSESPNQPDSDRVSFHFTPGNQPDTLALERLAGGGLLIVDGKVVLTSAPIKSGSIINVGTLQYRCDVVSRGYLPENPMVQANWITMTGSVRDHNEDAIGIYQHKNTHCFVLADGVGGAEAGEFVSEFAVKRFLVMFHRHVSKPDTDWHDVMEDAVKQINGDVREFADQMSNRIGKPVQAGSTLVGVVIDGWDAYLVHVGDSRLYYWRSGVLRQTTADHSTFMENIYARILAGDTTAPIKRNVLLKGIGKDETIEPDLITLRLQPGDKILMCSDGMSDKVEQDEIADAIARRDIRDIPSYLANLGDQRHSNDNVSVIFIDVETEASPLNWKPAEQERAFVGFDPRWRNGLDTRGVVRNAPSSAGKIIAAAIIIILVVVIGLLLLQSRTDGGTPIFGQPSTPATTDAPSSEATPTATETLTPTVTLTPSRTPTRTHTFTPTNTPIPPTSTLVPTNTP